MVLRILMRFLANNEQLVNRLADSKPIRQAARFVVYMLSRTSSFSGSHTLPSNSKEFGQQLLQIAKRLSTNIKKEIKDAQDSSKKKK